MPLILTPGERQSPLWQKIREYYAGYLLDLRAKNDGFSMDERATAFLRGQLCEVKAILCADRDAQERERGAPTPGGPTILTI